MRALRLLACLGLALCSFPCLPAQAMVAVKRDFADLVARAEQIVVGTVIKISSGESQSGSPLRLVTLGDLTVLKGSVGNELTLQFYGGAQGDVATRIFDMPQFKEGERAVLFVSGNGRDVCPLVGVWQGRFRVRFDADRNVDVIETDDGSLVVGRAKRNLRYAPAASSAAKAITLDEFRGMIADELAHPSRPEASQP